MSKLSISGGEFGIYICNRCGKKDIFRDIQFFNDKPMCMTCFRKISATQKKHMTCRVIGCKNERRADMGSEYCDFHIQERLEMIIYEIGELGKYYD